MVRTPKTQQRQRGRRGWAFVSYAHDDKARIQPIVDYLQSRRIDVWWDDLLKPGDRWGELLQEKLRSAECTVVIWSRSSVRSMFVEAETRAFLDRANSLGRLVPVLLDKEAAKDIPLPFNILQHQDLSEWDGRGRRPLKQLADRVRDLVNRPRHRDDDWPMLEKNEVAWVKKASRDMRDLGRRVGKVAEVMVSDADAVGDIHAALNEVHRTLDIVSDAVTEFVAAGVSRDGLDANPYVRIERGSLQRQIRDGKGQCDLIALHYAKPDGIRNWLQANASKRILTSADKAFERLSEADRDLFEMLARIGDALTNEARIIVNLLVAEQTEAARERIREGRDLLRPLEADLNESIETLQEIERSLGFAASQIAR